MPPKPPDLVMAARRVSVVGKAWEEGGVRMKTFTVAPLVVLVGGLLAFADRTAAAQPRRPPVPPVPWGKGTPRTVPVWTGSGTTLGDSHIHDNGAMVTVTSPMQVSGSGNTAGVSASSTDGTGVAGFSSNSNGIEGSTAGTAAGVVGSGVIFGVLGHATANGGQLSGCCITGVAGDATNENNPDLPAIGVGGYVSTPNGWGTQGLNQGGGIGVLAESSGGNGHGTGLMSRSDGGDAGVFLVGAGGTLLHGFLENCNGPGCWDEKFRVDAAGNLWIYGDALKPGGGSWSTLSDRRVKKSIEPINGALGQLLELHGVTYEYTDPSALHESPGTHIGMVAQEVEQVFPSWVDTGADGLKHVTFRGFEAVAVEAVRELDARLASNSQEAAARIEGLERQNAELRRAIEVLAEKVSTLQHE
jgi:hypothetical protein